MFEEVTDQILIRRYLNGKPRAFDRLLQKYQKPLYSFIMKMVADTDIANDIFQDTLVRVIKALPDYKDTGKFSSWLFSIAHNLCRDHWRRQKLEGMAEPAEMDTPEDTDVSRTPLAELIAIENTEWLRKAIDRLNPKLKEVVLLHTYSEMSFREIAEQLNVSINTVLGRMHYAKQHLIEEWNTHHDS